MVLAPVILFAYRRKRHLAAVVEGLRSNPEARETTLIVYCDAAKSPSHSDEVSEVRDYVRGIKGFGDLRIIERECNYGLSRSITEGVTHVCDEFGRAVVLEDDIVPTPFFLAYVNAALDRYADDDRVLSIGCFPFNPQGDLPDTFFVQIPDCWGWAVWKRSWNLYNPDATRLFERLRQRELFNVFDFDGAYPYRQMLKAQAQGKVDSWAIRWYATTLLENKLVLYPGKSVVTNIGFDGSGTHGSEASSPTSNQMNILADAPIAVRDVPIHECARARRSWALTLDVSRGSRFQNVAMALQRRIRRLLRPAHRSQA
jgi:hypothetical protein